MKAYPLDTLEALHFDFHYNSKNPDPPELGQLNVGYPNLVSTIFIRA
jgi:hypothetical protein